MSKREMVVMRGLPGSGKSYHIANNNGMKGAVVCSADDLFYNDQGVYVFQPWLIGKAHEACKVKLVKAMMAKESLVVVDNTNTQAWEYELYPILAEALGYKFELYNIFDGGLTDQELFERCKHGVPLEAIGKMRDRWE